MTDRLIAAGERRRTYHLLDALRGVAAIAVVMFHYPLLLGPLRASGAYLAVDLFFLMSGIVIAHAYEPRFAGGLSAARFFLLRIARLYPMFAVGTAISGIGIAAALAAGVPMVWTAESLAIASATSALFLPAPPLPGKPPALYPLNFPAWSLAFELIVNLAFAAFYPWLRDRRLGAVIALSGAALIALTLGLGRLDGGVDYPSIPSGLARVTFSFLLGVAMSRAARDGRWPTLRLPVPLLLAATALALIAPTPDTLRPVYDLACVLLVFPLLVWAAIHSEPRRGIAACTFLGLISYPLYTIHIPAQLIVMGVVMKLAGDAPGRFAPALGIAVIAALIAAAWLLARYVDPPLRRLLEQRLAPGRSAARDEDALR